MPSRARGGRGHGTLIRDYSNVADPDHPHAGLHLRVGGERWRFEAALDNLIDPSVVAARVSARPVSKARALQVGASLVIDPRAPLQIELAQALGAQFVETTLPRSKLRVRVVRGALEQRRRLELAPVHEQLYQVGVRERVLRAGNDGQRREKQSDQHLQCNFHDPYQPNASIMKL